MIYIFITFILDILFSNIISLAYQNINYFFPLLLVSSIPIFYLLIKNNLKFFTIIIIIGLLYDLLYSDIFLINTYYFLLYSFFIYIFYLNKKITFLNIFLLSFLGIILYDTFIFFILIFLDYSTFKIQYLYYKELRSILVNIIYIIFSYLLLKSRIFGSKKHIKY